MPSTRSWSQPSEDNSAREWQPSQKPDHATWPLPKIPVLAYYLVTLQFNFSRLAVAEFNVVAVRIANKFLLHWDEIFVWIRNRNVLPGSEI